MTEHRPRAPLGLGEIAAQMYLDGKSAGARETEDEYHQLTTRMGELLAQTANALKGEPAELHLHDWSDLPRVAQSYRAALLDVINWLDPSSVTARALKPETRATLRTLGAVMFDPPQQRGTQQ